MSHENTESHYQSRNGRDARNHSDQFVPGPAMNTKPMIFTTENIRGIRDGRKTMTRRVIKPQPSEGGLEWCTAADGAFSAWQDPLLLLDEHSEDGGPCQRVCPYGVPGDLLWVRETWCPCLCQPKCVEHIAYRSSDQLPPESKWKPSIHMPRTLSRLTLRVSNVRVERVQDISHDDVVAEDVTCRAYREGVPLVDIGAKHSPVDYMKGHGLTVGHFAALWDAINAKRGYSWESDPYVWVIEWDKVWEKNVDAVIKELAA